MAYKTLAEAKDILKTEKIHEVDTAFLVNDFGKYRPNITFVIPKEFERSPIAYHSGGPAKEMLANMNVGFNGDASVMFGDYWQSKKGGACFRLKHVSQAKHVLIRVGWGGAFNRTRGIGWVDGVPYYRRAASNGGGVGTDYLVVPIGYVRKVHDDEVDGDAQSPEISFEDNAKALRQEYAQYEQKLAEEAVAREVSRQAKDGGLGARLAKLNEQLKALGGNTIWLQDHCYRYGWGDKDYTEENVTQTETEVARAIERLKEQAAEKARKEQVRADFHPKFEVFAERAKALELKLNFGDERVSLGSGYGHPYSVEGIIAFEKELGMKEAEAAEERRKAESLLEDQGHIANGCPQDFTCRHERGHGKTHRSCWVIQPDGKEREADHEQYARHKHVATVWNVVRPSEVALMWEKSSRSSAHRFTVVHMQTENLTDEQVATICEILEGLEESWDGAAGIASGKLSPIVGDGWLHPKTGESLTKGFQTSRQKREQGDKHAEEEDRMASSPFAVLAELKK